MFNHRTMAIIKRELKGQVMTKSFIIMTILMPVIMFGLIGLQAFLMSYESTDQVQLIVIEESEGINTELQPYLAEQEYVQSGQFIISHDRMSRSDFEAYLKDSRQALIGNEISGIFYVPDSAKSSKEVEFYSANPGNMDVIIPMRSAINQILVKNYFIDKDISEADLEYAQKRVGVERIQVSEEGIAKQSFGNMIVAFIFTILLFLSLLIIGQNLMLAVNQEKSNRVVEILLSSVNARELMTGKIIGTALAGLTQMAIWMLPIVILAFGSFGFIAIVADLNLQLKMSHISYFFVNYLIGLVTFLALFAAFGSIFENQQDAQSGIWPLMLLIMIPFYMTFTLARNPANLIAEVASMVPFASIMLMPARMTVIAVPFWQIAVALLVNLLALYLILKAVGKIYRVGILVTGKKPSWPEVYKWLRYQT